MLIGSFMPWIDPETLGPLRPGDYVYVYFVLCVPTLLMMGAFCFALTTMTRSMLTTYVGVVVLLMIYFVATAFFRRPGYERIVALVEPFGMGAFTLATKYWTWRNATPSCHRWRADPVEPADLAGSRHAAAGAAWASSRVKERPCDRKALADDESAESSRVGSRTAGNDETVGDVTHAAAGPGSLRHGRGVSQPAFFVLLAFGS